MKLEIARRANRLWRKKRVRKFLIALMIILVLAGLVAYIVRILNSPAEGTISKNTTEAAPITDSTSYSTLNTAYFNLLYPSQFSQDYHQTAGGVLDYKYFSVRGSPQPEIVTASLEVYVRPLPQGGVTLDSDYKFYASNSKSYKAGKKLQNNDTVDLFYKDNDGRERNALWEHGSYVLIIKLHGSLKDQDTDQQIKTIIGSVRWLKQ